jgi:glycosyltransferase involved in cell wall biosynthesis
MWHGIHRVHIRVGKDTAKNTVIFDWRAIRHAAQAGELCLILGYNTAIFSAWLRFKGVPNLINMDGIEWRRSKWNKIAKVWFWLNEWAGCLLANHLIADHPEIAKHLQRRIDAKKITTIGYGADLLQDIPEAPVHALGLTPGSYLTLIARPEPENSVLEIVQAFSEKKRDVKLVVLGNYTEQHYYQRAVKDAASNEVFFLGAIYEKDVVQSLRYHSVAYVHGHQVGGTNPSLVEALAAGNPVIAHDNRFNRWVAGDQASYFSESKSLSKIFDDLLIQPKSMEELRTLSAARYIAEFTWERTLGAYEHLLLQWRPH